MAVFVQYAFVGMIKMCFLSFSCKQRRKANYASMQNEFCCAVFGCVALRRTVLTGIMTHHSILATLPFLP